MSLTVPVLSFAFGYPFHPLDIFSTWKTPIHPSIPISNILSDCMSLPGTVKRPWCAESLDPNLSCPGQIYEPLGQLSKLLEVPVHSLEKVSVRLFEGFNTQKGAQKLSPFFGI